MASLMGCGALEPSVVSDPAYKAGGSCGANLGSSNPKRHDVNPIERISPHLVYPQAVAKDQDRLYIARSHRRLSVVDLSDPGQLRRMGGLNLPHEVHSLLVRDQIAVVFANDTQGKDSFTTLITVDLRDPTQPKELSRQRRLGRLSAIQEQENSVFVKLVEHELCADCKDTRGQRVVQLDWEQARGLVQKQEWFVPLMPNMRAQDGLALSETHLAFVSVSSPTQALKSRVHLIARSPAAAGQPGVQTLDFDGWIQEPWQTRFQKDHLLVSVFATPTSPSSTVQATAPLESEPGEEPHDLREDCELLEVRSFDLSQSGPPREVYSKTLNDARFELGEWSPRMEYGADKGLLFSIHSQRVQIFDLQDPRSPKLSNPFSVQARGHWVQECEIRGNEALLFGFDRPWNSGLLDDGVFVAKLLDLSKPMAPKIVDQLEFGSYELRHSAHRNSWYPSLWRHDDLLLVNVGYNDDAFGPTDPYCEPDKRSRLQLIDWTPGQLKLRGYTSMPPGERNQLVHAGQLLNYNGDRITRVKLEDRDAPVAEQDLLVDRPPDALYSFDEAHWLVAHHDTWRNELVVQLVSKDPRRNQEVLTQHIIPGSPNARCIRSPYVVDGFMKGKTAHLWVEGFETIPTVLPTTPNKPQWRSAGMERDELVRLLAPEARLISIDFQDPSRPRELSSLAVPAVRTPMGSAQSRGTLPGHTLGTSDLIRLGDTLLVKERIRGSEGEFSARDWQIDLGQPVPELRPIGPRHALRYTGGFSKVNPQQAYGWEAYPESGPAGDSDARELRVEMQRYHVDESGQVARETQNVSGIPIGFHPDASHTTLVNYRYEAFEKDEDYNGIERNYPDSDNSKLYHRLVTEVLSSNLAYGRLSFDETTTLSSNKNARFLEFAGLGRSFLAKFNKRNPLNNEYSTPVEIYDLDATNPHSLPLPGGLIRIERLTSQRFLIEHHQYGHDPHLTIVELQASQSPRLTRYRIPEGVRCATPNIVGSTLICATGFSGIMRFDPVGA